MFYTFYKLDSAEWLHSNKCVTYGDIIYILEKGNKWAMYCLTITFLANRRKHFIWKTLIHSHAPQLNIFPLTLYKMAKSLWTPDHHTYTCLFTVHPKLQSSRKAFCQIMKRSCGDLCSLSQKSISEVRHWWKTRRSGVWSAKMFSGLEIRVLWKPLKFFYTTLGKPCLPGPHVFTQRKKKGTNLGKSHIWV